MRESAGPDPRRAAQTLDVLYRAEATQVYRYAHGLCGNAAWAADATQEAFVALAQRRQGFDPGQGLAGRLPGRGGAPRLGRTLARVAEDAALAR